MLDKYILMHKDIPVGDLTYDTSTKKFTFEKYDSIKDRIEVVKECLFQNKK